MRNRNWVFGKRAKFDIVTSPIASLAPGATPFIQTGEGCASISDIAGNLVMYSDGVTVWDANGFVRAAGLLGHTSSTQSALIVPDPKTKNGYYVLTTSGDSGGNNHFNGIRIVAGGAWPTTPLTGLPSTKGLSPTERLTAIRHANGKDYWIITIVQKMPNQWGLGQGIYRIFKLTASGVAHHADQAMGLPITDIGQLKASGGEGSTQRLAFAEFGVRQVVISKFSNVTGLVDLASVVALNFPQPTIGHLRFPYGVEFDKTGRLLYFSTTFPLALQTPNFIFQIAVHTNVITLVGTYQPPNGNVNLGSLQYAKDEKIYIAQGDTDKLGVINSPSIPGVGCNVTFDALPLATGAKCHLGLPNFIRDLF